MVATISQGHRAIVCISAALILQVPLSSCLVSVTEVEITRDIDWQAL